MAKSEILRQFADDLAAAVPEVDSRAEHDRWQNGIGPFEEDRQLSMLRETIGEPDGYSVEAEVVYPDSSEKCDVVLSAGDLTIPVEAKLVRFRYDNGNIDPNSFAKVFSPFPERSSGSLLTDAQKVLTSGFGGTGALLGLYYEENDEEYEHLTADRIAEKVCDDVEFWYDTSAEVAAISRFDGLRHPVHQHGAIIVWNVLG